MIEQESRATTVLKMPPKFAVYVEYGKSTSTLNAEILALAVQAKADFKEYKDIPVKVIFEEFKKLGCEPGQFFD